MKNNAGRKPDPAKASQSSPMKSIFEEDKIFKKTMHPLHAMELVEIYKTKEFPDSRRRNQPLDALWLIDYSGDCWEWLGSRMNDYGQFMVDYVNYRAHRFIYELLVADIPAGYVIDHLCRNKGCVNPEHLEPVTDLENLRRGIPSPTVVNARKTHCLRGHEFNTQNTYFNKFTGYRFCKACGALRKRIYRSPDRQIGVTNG